MHKLKTPTTYEEMTQHAILSELVAIRELLEKLVPQPAPEPVVDAVEHVKSPEIMEFDTKIEVVDPPKPKRRGK